jgi:large subunit ribosomal protein L4
MTKVDIYTTKGEKKGKITLPKKIFAAKINPALVVQAIRVYLSNQRLGLAKVKSRGEVSFSTRKIYRQKGTGRARHGDRGAPIFVKGGVAHGPTGEQNYKRKMSKTMKQKALFSVLSSKLNDNQVIVLDGLDKIKPKTKNMIKVLENLKFLKIKNSKLGQKIGLILPEQGDNIKRAAGNIEKLNLMSADSLNVYKLLNSGSLIFAKDSIDKLKSLYLKGDKLKKDKIKENK